MKKVTSVLKSENVITSILLFCSLSIINLGGTSAFALDLMGPPVTNLQQSQFQSAIEYSQSTIEIQIVNGIYNDNVIGGSFDTGEAADLEIKDFKASMIYSYFGYSFANNLEAFVRLGTTSSEFDGLLITQSKEFESDDTPVVGGGIKVTLYDDFRLKLGGLIQANWANYNGQYKTSTLDTHYVGIDTKEVQIALGAIYKWTDYISVYGGPVYHFITGEFDDVFSIVDFDTGKLRVLEYMGDIESNSSYGGYLGAQVDLNRNLYLNFEYQLLGSSDAFGANVVWKY